MQFLGEALEERIRNKDKDAHIIFEKEREGIFESINHKIEEQYFLLKRDILREWTWVSTRFTDETSKEHMSKLRNLLETEYNDVIIPAYQKLTGNRLLRIA
jgi:hypothetical protein